MKKRAWFIAVLTLSLVAGACSSSGGEGIVVDDPWGRSSPKVANNGAFYMTIGGSDVDDRLVAVYASVCGATELHQTIMTDGVMRMQQAEGGIEIPAGGEAVLAPGGYHVMCINKDIEFKVGDIIPLTLTFEKAEMQTVDAEIREG
jgi:copper(I)-binding protein